MSFALSVPFDALSTERLKSLTMEFATSSPVLDWEKGALDIYTNTIIPRSVFFRNLPTNAAVLDLGAGDGGLSTYRTWPLVERLDIKMYAVSLDVGERFHLYEKYELANFEQTLPDFGGMLFDAIICAHFVEHIHDPARALRFFASRLKPGGRVYIEWPHPISKRMPTLDVFRALGVNVMTTNFFDDDTHVEAWEMDMIAGVARTEGLQINECGRIWFDHLADQLLAHGKATNDSVSLTYAVWYKFAWAQYLTIAKPFE